MNDEMEEIIQEFITEAEESLDRIEPRFVELEQKGQDADLINEIFRSMHTIKGAAGFLGLQLIVDVAHTAENIMKKLRDNEITLSKNLMDAILEAIDMLRLLLIHLKEKDGIEEDVAPLVQELNKALKAAVSNSKSSGKSREIPAEQASKVSKTSETMSSGAAARQPIDTANAAASVQESDLSEKPSESSTKPQLNKELTQAPEIPKTASVDPVTTAESSQTPSDNEQKPNEMIQAAKDNTQKAQNLRVDVSRIDKVMDLAGEIVLVRNRLLNISNYFDIKHADDQMTEVLAEAVSFLDRITSDTQIAVMKMRMQPIQKIFSKFPRLVRDISASVKKDVELQIFGEGTEVDKTVIEHIGDPMTHILRNSIDHGLESSEERIAGGKPPKGKIVINTYQKGTQIVIEIMDDGKGIDVSTLRRKAVEKGIMTEEEAFKMSDDDAINIIFLPGFSTKETASELSGRGVGMDVVKTNISLLNGYVEVSTEKGKGTMFRINIPLTLAIIQALMVEVDGAKYAIPLSPIEETLKVAKKDITDITGQDVIVIRDKICPLFDLRSALGLGHNGNNDDIDFKYVIVISMGDKKYCIAVDRLLGQEEVVIKTLNGLDATSSYVLGATITGDGRVVFILDVTGLSKNLLGSAKV
jgi:two-component system chemotaxis sensor kinase CheA